MTRTRPIVFICLLAMGGSVNAEESFFEAATKSSCDDRYDMGRFYRKGVVRPESTGGPQRLSTSRQEGIADPAVRRVQHSTEIEEAPFPPDFGLAQTDFLDDLLNENDVTDPAAKNPLNESSVQARQTTLPGGAREAGRNLVQPLNQRDAAADVNMTPTASSSLNPTPQSQAFRRSSMANQPYTLGGILEDENEELECLCEQEFCQAMWQCAGGRNLSWCSRLMRDFNRNNAVIWQGNGGNQSCQSNPMRNWQCSYRQQHGEQGYCPHCSQALGGEWQVPFESEMNGFPVMEGEITVGAPMEAAPIEAAPDGFMYPQ